MRSNAKRLLVIGSGAREHTLCWALHTAAGVELFCLPGNGGTAMLATNVALDPMDFAACADWATAHQIDLTIVGPDDPLGGGIVDVFQARGLRCFGPTRAAARIESSKAWAKSFMARHQIPTAAARIVTAATLPDALHSFYAPEASFPVVIKADGLARGRGVVIASDAAAAEAALQSMLGGQFGAAGDQVIVEAFMPGREVSVFALCDGTSYRLLGTACDHKRAYDDDAGPNTGGMGAYAPAIWLTADELDRIERTIIAPAVAGMAAEGHPFTGFLYAGLMMTATGPSVVEFNARFGDPEAQVVLPLLRTPLLDLIDAATEGCLAALEPPAWTPGATCGVVIAAAGYPESGSQGEPISGLVDLDADMLVFHGGTRRLDDGTFTTNGGRIITLVGIGPTLEAARERVYTNVDRVRFTGARHRSDIALAALG